MLAKYSIFCMLVGFIRSLLRLVSSYNVDFLSFIDLSVTAFQVRDVLRWAMCGAESACQASCTAHTKEG
jgi:hypothetical protein